MSRFGPRDEQGRTGGPDPLRLTAHRPYPMPGGSWLMYQRWDDLLFAHWRVPLEALRKLVPPELPIDTFQGNAYVGVVPFTIAGLRARGLPPFPGLSAFPEMNVRTYVVLDGRPGVYFFSLDAGNLPAVLAARAVFHLRYFSARFRVSKDEKAVHYCGQRVASTLGRLQLQYSSCGPVFHAAEKSLEEFLVERYCLYATDENGRVYRCEIHHGPWPLQSAKAEFACNTLAAASGIELPDEPPMLQFARSQPTIIWPAKRV